MPRVGGRLCWPSRALARTALRTPSQLSPAARPWVTVPLCCSRRPYHPTPNARQELVPVAADKYLHVELPEKMQRAAARATWDDPRKVNKDKANEASMVDPTIRHFTVNFVRLPIINPPFL
jgi:hypothetical protein